MKPVLPLFVKNAVEAHGSCRVAFFCTDSYSTAEEAEAHGALYYIPSSMESLTQLLDCLEGATTLGKCLGTDSYALIIEAGDQCFTLDDNG